MDDGYMIIQKILVVCRLYISGQEKKANGKVMYVVCRDVLLPK